MKLVKNLFYLSLVLSLVFSASILMAYEPLDHDFEGNTLNITSWGDRAPKEGTEEYSNWLNIEDEYNVNIKYGAIPRKEAVQKIVAGVMGGNSPTDVHEVLSNKIYLKLAANQVLHPLDQILPDNFLEKLPSQVVGENIKEKLSIKGHFYGIPSTQQSFMKATVVAWNKDLVNEAGLTSIHELIEQDKWNWDKMREYAIALTKDTNGDGKTDQWGFSSIQSKFGPLIYSNGGSLTRTVDGKVKFAMNEERAIEAMNYLRKLIHEDNVVSDYNFRNFEALKNGKVAMFISAYWKVQKLITSGANFGLAFLPMGPKVDSYTVPVSGIQLYTIPVTTENPEAVVDTLYSIRTMKEEDISKNVEGLAANQVDRESYQRVFDITNNWQLGSPFWQLLIDNGLWGAVAQSVINGDKAVATAMQEVEPKLQSVLDDLLEQ